MSDDPRTHREDRSVEEFFARERDAAPVLDGDETRWRRIVASAGARHGRWGRTLLVAAAVAILAGALGWGLTRTGGSTGPSAPPTSSLGPSAPATPTPSSTGPATGSTPPSATSNAGSPALPVPASFRLRSVTTADSTHLFALGTLSCGTGSCPALVASTDNGATWHLVHTFPAATAPTGHAPGQPGGADQLSDVRFANRSVGWVFGGAALRTTDGGATWRTYPHPGGDVISLETDGRDVVLTAAPGCSAGTCHGSISVVRAPVAAASATDVAGMVDGGASVLGAAVAWHAGAAYVSPAVQPRPGSSVPRPVVVRPDGLHPAAPTACGNGEGSQFVAPASGPALFAVCPSSGAAGSVGYAVQSSFDGGVTWHPVSSDRLVLVNAGRRSFAAADGTSLLGVSGGSPDVHGSMAVSTDGGATWAPPAGAPPLPRDGWAWIGAPGGPTYYALSADPAGGYWKSTDRGQTWLEVIVAGS